MRRASRLLHACRVLLGTFVHALMLVLLFVPFLVTYMPAVSRGENSIVMRLAGKETCMRLLWFLTQYSPARARERVMWQAAVAKAKSLNPPPGGVAFVGSSTFTAWANLEKDMAPFPCFNAAFGGAWTSDVLPHIYDLVVKHKPKAIVYYCGTNDIARGMNAQTTAEGFSRFAGEVRAALPDVKLVYVSISLTPFQLYLGNRDKIELANQIVRSSVDGCHFVDLVSESRFTYDTSIYINDGLHLNDEGHRLLADKIRPVLKQVFEG